MGVRALSVDTRRGGSCDCVPSHRPLGGQLGYHHDYYCVDGDMFPGIFPRSVHACTCTHRDYKWNIPRNFFLDSTENSIYWYDLVSYPQTRDRKKNEQRNSFTHTTRITKGNLLHVFFYRSVDPKVGRGLRPIKQSGRRCC